MKNQPDPRRGAILPAAVILVIFLLVMGMTMLILSTVENKDALDRSRRETAFYLAEAGINKALAVLNKYGEDHEFLHIHGEDGTPYDGLKDKGKIILTYSSGYNLRTITSTARTGPPAQPIEETLTISQIGFTGIGYFTSTDMDERALFQIKDENGEKTSVDRDQLLQRLNRDDFPLKIQMVPEDWTGGEGYSELATDESGNLHLTQDSFRIESGEVNDHAFRQLKISGEGKEIIIENGVRLYIQDDINISTGVIRIADSEDPGGNPGVDIYIDESVDVIQLPGIIVTESGNPADLRIYSNSTATIKFPSYAADFYGILYAPDAMVDHVNHSNFHGMLLSDRIEGQRHNQIVAYPYIVDALSERIGVDLASARSMKWRKLTWRDRFK